MGKTKQRKSAPRSAFSYVSVGMQLSATILICVIGGFKLDQYYHKSPVFLICGTVLGMVIGFYSLFKELLGEKKDKSNSEKRDDDKNKWM